MLDLIDYQSALIERAKQANIRYLVTVQGEWAWCEQQARHLAQPFPRVLWAGDHAPENMQGLAQKKARQWLGQECDCLIFNGYDSISADALGALSGTVAGGGLLLLLLPPDGETASAPPSRQRLFNLIDAPGVIGLKQGHPLPLLPGNVLPAPIYQDPEFGCLTAEQTDAVHAIRRVVLGHRKRPLVLTADRGRGKSAALGIAAASLMRERSLRIVVTAPSFACAETLFRHAAAGLGQAESSQKQLSFLHSTIEFIAPDALLDDGAAVDFLIVDEAAAIPAPLLQAFLNRFRRIAFASTVHGYEGTGRGFAIKFRQQLDRIAPQWRAMKLSTPIRWAAGDPLESWMFKALLLDAEYPQFTLPLKSPVQYRTVSAAELLNHESYLSALFGLLVNAHYQTSPSDLTQILDDPDVQVIVAEAAQQLVGCVLLASEGGFSATLAQQVMLGQRRPRGHLLAQSVAAHLGLDVGAQQRCARIMRIAVHPDCQQQGIGSGLLAYCRAWGQTQSLDYLGTSFGLVPELLSFWQQAGYRPVRLGISKDAASGAHSMLMVLPLSTEAQTWCESASDIFADNFNAQRVEQFRSLNTTLFCQLYQNLLVSQPTRLPGLTAVHRHQLQIYAEGGLGYDLIVAALERWLVAQLAQATVIEPVLQMAVAKILQRQSWEQVVKEFGYAGKQQADAALRQLVAQTPL
ncbi:tRNA(Met) cytidine acetyltransferase TmcA [Photobacterium sp. TY1-4]|uniref:tRNA(Met) cytidine acetyltransferase TmcA n=1 Tax=Photobacterium sp. TY1-4 TaxID=2899122 RepID=UPI0021C23D01|nr:GNAT family N-acetyltransferase [Photobacterium sp. TY1-4]UXI03326.1 GNAT family N-acetyltransferase [Photobacterium sp. TY1-4]